MSVQTVPETQDAPPDVENYLPASVKACGIGSAVGVNPRTGQIAVVPLCCKSWACSRCAPRLARLWGRRIAEAKPNRLVTITCDPRLFDSPIDAYTAMKDAWYKFVTTWRKGRRMANAKKDRPHTLEYCAVWEVQPQTGYPHIHALIRGDYIPQAWIKAFFQRARIGSIVDIRKVADTEGAARYVVKYTGKAAPVTKQLIQRQRLLMISRNFLPPPTPAPDELDLGSWEWSRCSADAPDVLNLLRLRWRYRIDSAAWPALMILRPLDPDQDVGLILSLIDQLPPSNWDATET